MASGIGKVIVFYTKSKRPEAGIKRLAERLLAEWTRPILQRSDDYSKRVYQEAAFDPTYVLYPLTLPAILILTCIGNSPTAHPRPKRLRPKPGHENFFLPAWQTVPVPKSRTPATQWCLVQQWCRRANSRVLWEPVARIGSGGCGRDRLQPRRDLEDRHSMVYTVAFAMFFLSPVPLVRLSWRLGVLHLLLFEIACVLCI